MENNQLNIKQKYIQFRITIHLSSRWLIKLTDLIKIAKAFNTHFANIGKSLAFQIENSITNYKNFTQYQNTPNV